MEIRKLDKSDILDFIDLIKIFKKVFENSNQIPENEYLIRLLSNSDFMVFVVKSKGKVLGGLTIYILHSYYSIKPIAYIYDVGITPNHQGQGLGKKLIEEVGRYCKENGFEEAYVEAESDDIDAVNFYRKTNFTGELNAVHFTYTFSETE
jgi:aminoglycoside 3-N-acetyltransferase I